MYVTVMSFIRFPANNRKCASCEAMGNARKFLEEQNSEKADMIDKIQKEKYEVGSCNNFGILWLVRLPHYVYFDYSTP